MDWWRVGGWWRRKLWKLSVDTYKSLTSLVILSQSKLEYSCTDGDVYLLSASSTETCDTLYSSNKEEIEVASAVQPYEGELRASIANEDVDGVWQSRFLACGVQVKIRTKKLPLLNVCECCVCVMFSMAKSMFRIGSCTRVCCHNILFAPSATKVPLSQCSRVSLLWSNSLTNQKLTFDERMSCISCHRTGQREKSDFLVIRFKFISNRDFNREKFL